LAPGLELSCGRSLNKCPRIATPFQLDASFGQIVVLQPRFLEQSGGVSVAAIALR
jgi:hypothetical protein